jgi:hypothetical protein
MVGWPATPSRWEALTGTCEIDPNFWAWVLIRVSEEATRQGSGWQARTQSGTIDPRDAPTVALRNPAALIGPPAAAKAETLAAAVAKKRRENAPGVVLSLASAIDTDSLTWAIDGQAGRGNSSSLARPPRGCEGATTLMGLPRNVKKWTVPGCRFLLVGKPEPTYNILAIYQFWGRLLTRGIGV